MFHVEVNTHSCPPDAWTGNAVEHETADQAREAAIDLFHRWTAVRYWRVVDDEGQVIHTNQEA